MKLLIAIVSRDDMYALVDALSGEGRRATLIGTTGGFLRQGNATILIGVADENLAAVLKIVRATCRPRTAYISAFPSAPGSGGALASMPLEVQVGGAVVFTLDVERYEEF
jgi:uncharacterized protein YaaQ